MAQDFGKNVELNKALALATGYTGDFGGPDAGYRKFLEQADQETRDISDRILRNQGGRFLMVEGTLVASGLTFKNGKYVSRTHRA